MKEMVLLKRDSNLFIAKWLARATVRQYDLAVEEVLSNASAEV